MYYEHSKYAEYYGVTNSLALEHYGIKGQKWGLRRWQNEDGTLTEAGKDHYSVSTGGNKKLQRLYNRESKKLKRLKDYTDIDLQKRNAEKYDKRFKKAMKVGNVAAGTAAAALGVSYGAKNLNDHLKTQAKSKIDDLYGKSDRARRTAQMLVSDTWKKDGYKPGKGYSDEAWSRIDDIMSTYKSQDDKFMSQIKDTKNKFNQGANVRKTASDIGKYVGLASAGVAVGAYATAAYSKLMSRAASKRVSDIGHKKAVKEYQEHYNKMMKTFEGTPYADILKQQ